MVEGWSVSRPSGSVSKAPFSANDVKTSSSSSTSSSSVAAVASGWQVTRPPAVSSIDPDDFFGVRSRTFKAAEILKDVKEQQQKQQGSFPSTSSARPSMEVS